MSDERFRVVFVCTGNRFRSPLAAALLRHAAGDALVEVSSVGTLELDRVGSLPEAAEAAMRFGVDLSGHRTRSLATTSLRDADLVVGFERAHVVAAVVDGGAARDRTFTLPELTELLGRILAPSSDEPVARAREAVRRAACARPEDDRNLMSVSELADPLGRSRHEQAEIADRVRELVEYLRTGLFG